VAKRYFTPRGRLLQAITKTLIAAYRVTGGRVGGRLRGKPGILLTTTGRRSGERRTVHLPYLADGRDMLVVASWAGNQRNPAWYLNLVANPTVTVEAGRERFEALATPIPDDERDAVWAKVVADAPWYAEYQRQVDRKIPVVRLSR
jgi:deazaflavin-dependent oxidoreductase (nitroreductase family)